MHIHLARDNAPNHSINRSIGSGQSASCEVSPLLKCPVKLSQPHTHTRKLLHADRRKIKCTHIIVRSDGVSHVPHYRISPSLSMALPYSPATHSVSLLTYSPLGAAARPAPSSSGSAVRCTYDASAKSCVSANACDAFVELIIGPHWDWAANFGPWLGCLQEGKRSGARAYAERLCEDDGLAR